MSKASRKGLKFRIPNRRPEMVISFETTAFRVAGYAPYIVTEVEAHLGAVYAFCDYTQRAFWLGRHRKILYRAFEATVLQSDFAVYY